MAESRVVSPTPLPSPAKWAPVLALGWLVPGGGHFLLRRTGRGGILLDKVDEIGHGIADRAGQLKDQLDDRTRELRTSARLEGERILREYPLQTLACVAGAAFILGVSLRIVRANHAHRY